MTKKALRQLYNSKRLELAPQQLLKWDDLLLIHFQRLAFDDNMGLLLSYFPMAHKAEVDPNFFGRYLLHTHQHLQVAYPVINYAAGTMQAHLLNDANEVATNEYLIDEPLNGTLVVPTEIDVVFVPLLAFNKQGFRVGYGKGFYDRFLKTCREDVITIGFSYFKAVDHIDDLNQFDVPLNYCVTPQQLYEF